VIDALLAEAFRTNVPVSVEDCERFAMLEDLVIGVRKLRAGLDVVARPFDLG
jgi:hypothetical protein